MGKTCTFCGSSELEEDPARADVVCTQCGSVLEESVVVSEVQFQERAGGHDVIGQFVSRDRQQAAFCGIPGLSKTDSREITLQRGRKQIQEIANNLRINAALIEEACNFYAMCVKRNFTRGRPRAYTCAACLYITCRLNSSPHLLLDFSDATQVNVYELGRTLTMLTRQLMINLPTTDPCLYVLRFAAMLEFEDKQQQVVTLATRIVQRMKQDWISTGRRPTGLCGAALLLAARAHGFHRTISDVVKIVHISDTVVRKRLDEFAATPSGGLTIEDFQNIELESAEDPPAFQEAKRKAREDKRKKEELEAQKLTKDVLPVQKEIETALKEKFKRSKTGQIISGSVGEDDIPELDTESAEIVRNDVIDTVYDLADDEFDDDETCTSRYHLGPTAESLGITKPDSSFVTYQETGEEEIITNDNDFGDISDGEIDSYILSETEAKYKGSIWMERNGSILEEIERKRQEKKEEEERKKTNPQRRKRTAPKKDQNTNINAVNHQDAMQQIIKKKKLSAKINYDVLAEL